MTILVTHISVKMVICKFYANGYCKFGQNCRFEHTDNRNVYSKTYNQNAPSYNQNRNQQSYHSQQYSHNSQNHQNHQHHGGSSFSFSNVIQNQGMTFIAIMTCNLTVFLLFFQGPSTSTFSFNRAAQQISKQPQQQQQTTFSFRNAANQIPQNSFFGNTNASTQPSVFASNQSNTAKSFSFNKLLQPVDPRPSNGFQSPFSAVNEADMESESDPRFSSLGNAAATNSTPSFFANSNVTSTTFGGASFTSPNPTVKSFFHSTTPANSSSSFFGGGGSQQQQQSSNNSTFKSFFDKTSSRDVLPISNVAATSLAIPSLSSSEIYSKLDQLSQSDRACYEQAEFNFIPLKPPPCEVCF